MNILLLSTSDQGGGAETVATDLLRAYRAAGHDARMLVRYHRTAEPGVAEADLYAATAPWAPISATLERLVARMPAFRGQPRLIDWLKSSAWPQRLIDRAAGREDFNFPYAEHLLDDDGWTPDAIHAHNLHGNYFDLRALAPLSRAVPLIWTLHDAWALTGHCAYFIDCHRWRTGCGACPDLRRVPAISHDATAENWATKRQIYRQSQLAIATPSQWLADRVSESMLKPYASRVIANGVDRAVFQPGEQRAARAELNLPQNTFLAVTVAYAATTTNPYKDISSVRLAAQHAGSADGRMQLVCIGRTSAEPEPGVIYTGYLTDRQKTARYYQAADVLLHAANAENAPCVIQEALACGTPVIATSVGGIAEQISEGITGYLVPRGDSLAIGKHLNTLIQRSSTMRSLRQMTLARAAQVPSVEQQAQVYLDWFEELRVGLPTRSITAG